MYNPIRSMKMGSLFDGSGGFPLAGTLCGIKPVWASEVEPYPIAVTRSRFPSMVHLGDVSKVRGSEIEPVDVITFGSPCQDLSVAGKRAGLKHEDNGDEETTRSGLFMEAVRIIKEMREATDERYPTFAIWENVPGAYSSNKGEDFRIVLEELAKVKDPGASVPGSKKWQYAGCIMGDGYSIAWRTFDAQYWGVPQRRRRIYLVADFRGQRAGEILFKSEGVSGPSEQSGQTRERTSGHAERSTGADDRTCIIDSIGGQADNVEVTVDPRETDAVPYTLKIRSGCAVDSAGKAAGKGALIQGNKAATLACSNDRYLFQPVVYDARGNGNGETVSTLTGDHENRVTDYTAPLCEPVAYNGENVTSPLNKTNPQPGDSCHTLGTDSRNYLVYCLQGNGIDRADTAGCNGKGWREDACYTLNTIDRPAVVYSFDSLASNSMKSSNPLSGCREVDIAKTLDTSDGNPSKNQGGIAVVEEVYAMQGFGDYKPSNVASGLKARDYKDTTDLVLETPIAIDRAFFNQEKNAQYDPQYYTDGTTPTLVARGPSAVAQYVDTTHADDVVRVDDVTAPLQARDYKGGKLVQVRHIVRRLTPTECARLQGFPDTWGHPDKKTEFTDEEYAFWTEVRCTHAMINGREPKTYGREQMLNWYNKLHTDSSEYKMWGNGIALLCALYVMQGIADALKAER